MEIVYERCSGLDVHKKKVVVCSSTPDAAGQRLKETRTFRTTTQDLLHLLDWLKDKGCTHIAMESTGVYWKPIYNGARAAVAVGHTILQIVCYLIVRGETYHEAGSDQLARRRGCLATVGAASTPDGGATLDVGVLISGPQ